MTAAARVHSVGAQVSFIRPKGRQIKKRCREWEKENIHRVGTKGRKSFFLQWNPAKTVLSMVQLEMAAVHSADHLTVLNSLTWLA